MASESDPDEATHRLRYMDVVEEPMRMLPPLQGFEMKPVVPLEQAVESIVSILPRIESQALLAKNKCNMSTIHGLSKDESASIRLYTMGSNPPDRPLYVVLNETLRAEDRDKLKPWFLYLRLLIGSLLKIPPTPCHAYRGMKGHLPYQFKPKQEIVWWGFSSCTKSLQVLENPLFCGKTGDRTIFDIECYSGIDIIKYSRYPTENEILLLPATQFEIISSLDVGNGLRMIQMKEVPPNFAIRAQIPGVNISSPAVIKPVEKQSVQDPSKPIIEQPKPTPHHKESGLLRRNSNLERRIARGRPRSKVDLSRQQVTDDDIEIVIDDAIYEKKCTNLDLQDNRITSDGMLRLAERIRDSTTLEELNLSSNNLGDAGVFHLAKQLSVNEKQSVVKYQICGIACMEEVDKAPIKTLDLSKNNIGNTGVGYLVDVIRTKRTLTTLYLSGNRISDEGVKLLADALCHSQTHLQRLYLEENELITDTSTGFLINILTKNQSLNALWLRRCNLTSLGIQSLQDAAKSKPNFKLYIQ